MAEGRKLRYKGPFAEGIYVAKLGATVLPNHQITVEDDAIADSLAAQADWEEVGAAKKEAPIPIKAGG